MNQIKTILALSVILGFLTCQQTEKKDDTTAIVGLLALQSQQKSATAATPTSTTTSSCNTSGVSAGCTSSAPFSCSAVNICYASLSTCQANTSCSGFAISYTSQASNAYFVTNTAITTITPSISGTTGTGAFTISPSLPAGLTISSTTGEISGTPTAIAARTTYTVNATFGGITKTGTVSFQIVSSLSTFTCNTTGTAAGCTGTSPFSCSNSLTCYSTYSSCVSALSCGY